MAKSKAHTKVIPERTQKPWTAKELSILTEDWGKKSIPSIAKKLERSVYSVKIKARKLGLGAVLMAGDYITLNQLAMAVTGQKHGDNYKLKSWVENRGLPVHTRKVEKCSFRVVYLKEFWEWAEKNRSFIDFTKMEPLILGEEPSWVEAQRKKDFTSHARQRRRPWTAGETNRLIALLKMHRYSYTELSKELNRTNGAIQRKIQDLGLKERPLRADNHNRWTEAEVSILKSYITEGEHFDRIGDEVGRSEKAVRGKVSQMYGTEDLDKVRRYLCEEDRLVCESI